MTPVAVSRSGNFHELVDRKSASAAADQVEQQRDPRQVSGPGVGIEEHLNRQRFPVTQTSTVKLLAALPC